MRNGELTRVVLISVCSQFICGASAPAADKTIPGERLDPATYGPGIVETMADALERERLARQAGSQDADRPEAKHGVWAVPSRRATYFPHAGEHNVVNKFGDTHMGIGFPSVVDVRGAYFAGQGGEGTWTTGLRVIGYRDGREVAKTDWFGPLGEEPKWFAMNLGGVDRIVLMSTPVVQGGGWYGMDDLTFTVRGEGADGKHRLVVLGFEDLPYNTPLTGSGYAGLVWEIGRGDFEPDGVPAPRLSPTPELVIADETADDQTTTPDLRGGAGSLPTLTMDFQGVIRGDVGSFSYPPDTCGAVGPNHFVETVNRVFAVYEKSTGTELMSIGLGAFLPGSSGDPRVLFDQHSGRWVVLNDDFNTTLYLAVSITDDPTGSWFKTSIVVSTGGDSGRWPDYPTLGVDENGIYMAAYMVGGPGMSIFAIDKAPLIAPSPSLGTVTAWRNLPWEGAIQPAHTYGSPAGEYLISRSGSTSLRLRRINAPLTSPTMSELGYVSVPSHSSPPDAPSLGSGTPLDTVDYRPMNAVYRDGSLWTTHCIYYSGRAACRWYEINPLTVSTVQVGTVSDGSLYYFFPSIAVNQFGRVVLGFTGSNAGQYASAYYTGRMPTDPAGQMAPPALLHAGTAAQNLIDGYGRNRFGDYSLTSLDPADELSIWTIQEYVHATDIWGTWIGVLASADCNGNGIDDREDILQGTSNDCNANDVPDECEPNEDCNANSVQDICDIAAGTSVDCNNNKVPDECDVSAGTSADIDANTVPDECEATVLYVDAAGGGMNRGTTWGDAYTDLQSALDIAALPGTAVTQVWVKAGTYRPSALFSPTDPRSATFSLADGVSLLGGFAGGETDPSQRNPSANTTIISGDLAMNDGIGDTSENCYHPVSATDLSIAPVLDGFTITGGFADGFDITGSGGGLYVSVDTPGAAPLVTNCIFEGNYAADKGGAIFTNGAGAPTISQCTIINNSTANNGGGIFTTLGSPTIIDCLILGNSSGNRGGGVYVGGDAGGQALTNCVVSGNSAASGGGLATRAGTTVSGCSLSRNTATLSGGGIYNFRASSNLTVANSIFWENSDPGGMDESAQIHIANGTTTITDNCIQGWTTPGVDGNIELDPQFVNALGGDGTAGTGDDDLHLQDVSPCIDAGANALVPSGVTTDLDGAPRIVDGDEDTIADVDMGAYEFSPPGAGCTCGDIDASGGDVDLNDFNAFSLCYGFVAPGGDCPAEAFACSDLDATGDVTLNDFGTFAILFGGISPNQVPNCLD